MGQGMKVKMQKIFFLFFKLSFNNPPIATKFLQEDLKTLPEGSVSQNLDLGSR